MSEHQPTFSNWKELARYRADLLISALAKISELKGKYSSEFIEAIEAPYRKLIEELYTQEYPIAELLDESDLAIAYFGPTLEGGKPIRLSLISTLFTDVKGAVAKLTKSLVGLSSGKRLPPELDLALAGLARGSLYLGFKTPISPDNALFGDGDPIYQATKTALQTLGLVIKDLSLEDAERALARDIPDPVVRDAALRAVKELSPPRSSGIREVQIMGTSLEKLPPITPEVRKKINALLSSPQEKTQTISVRGRVREIDLDNRRFTLRSVEIPEGIQEVLVVYREEFDMIAKEYLDHLVEVQGKSEGTGERIRVFAEDIEVLS